MAFKSLLDSLSKICATPAGDKACAMDIVDRNGRHHEPKGVPPGGQFESEGQYATTAKAKEEWFHKAFAHGSDAKTKKQREEMRQHCASILQRMDSSKLGNDTARHYYKEQVHKYADMTKQSVLDGAHNAFEDMKKHAATYEQIKDMSKEDFTKWVEQHPEYNSTQMQNLLTNKAYNKKYTIKNESGESVEQDHEAWEEAKMLVSRKAMASMLDYMAHIEALNNTPDGMIDSYIHGKGDHGSHKGGHEDYAAKHGIKHGEGESAGKVSMSEIQAVESEMSKANEDLKGDEAHKSYMHALSHFLGKDNGGMRDPNATHDSVKQKVQARIADKQKKLDEAKQSGNEDEIKAAQHDLDSTQKAADVVHKVLGWKPTEGGGQESPKPVETDGDPAKQVAANPPPVENITTKPTEIDGDVSASPSEPKKTITAAGKKFKDATGAYLSSDLGKKYAKLVESLPQDEKDAHQKILEGNSMADNKALYESLYKDAKTAHGKGDKEAAKKAVAKYHMTVQHIYNQLSGLDEE